MVISPDKETVEIAPINIRSSTNINKLYHDLIQPDRDAKERELKEHELAAYKSLQANKSDWLRWRADIKTKEFLFILEDRRNFCLAVCMEDKLKALNFSQEARLLTEILNYVTLEGQFPE